MVAVAENHTKKGVATREKSTIPSFLFLEKQTIIQLCGTLYHHSPAKRANDTVVITYCFQASALADQYSHYKGHCNHALNEVAQFFPENVMKVLTIRTKVIIFHKYRRWMIIVP